MSEEESPVKEQYYSTGRGGKGNVTAAKSPELRPQKSTQSQLEAMVSHDKDGNFIMSTGRGGHSNLVHTTSPPPPPLLQPTVSTSSQLQPVFSTGRGGYGNMKSNQANGDQSTKKGLLSKIKKIFQ